MRMTLLALIFLGVVANLAVSLWWKPFMAYIQGLSTCDSLPWLRGLVIGFAAMFWVIAYISVRNAKNILTSGQFPPPGALVWSPTPIRKDWVVWFNGYGWLFLASAFALLPLVVVYTFKVHTIFCLPDACGC